jgi:hypothetical protein
MSRSRLLNSIRSVLQVYEAKLAQSYPKIYKVYKVITIGSSRFGSDTFQYLKLKQQLFKNENKQNYLTFKDVEIIQNVLNLHGYISIYRLFIQKYKSNYRKLVYFIYKHKIFIMFSNILRYQKIGQLLHQ